MTTDIGEAKYSADQMRAMLAKGQAMRNEQGEPSYPIADQEDLRKAIHAVGRGGSSHDKIRAYIKRRAKAMGHADMIPDHWSSNSSEAASLVVTETVDLAESVHDSDKLGRRMRLLLINEGWGSSGYYGADVLREAAESNVFPAGLHMYLNHPTSTEERDRPERAVEDLAAVLEGPARYEGGALWAEAKVFSDYQSVLREKREHIGVSIRASGTAEAGEADGRRGTIITSITTAHSVDFVTKPGRGGQIVEVLEAARSKTGRPEATEKGTHMTTEARAPVTEETTTGASTATGSLNESDRLRADNDTLRTRLAEANLKITELTEGVQDLADTKTALDEAHRANFRLLADKAAREKALTVLAKSTLPEVAHERVVESVTGDHVPLDKDGKLDETVLAESIKKAIETERRYLARFAEAEGIGTVRGLGSVDGTDTVDVEAQLGAVFTNIGMSEGAAKAAAKGRG